MRDAYTERQDDLTCAEKQLAARTTVPSASSHSSAGALSAPTSSTRPKPCAATGRGWCGPTRLKPWGKRLRRRRLTRPGGSFCARSRADAPPSPRRGSGRTCGSTAMAWLAPRSSTRTSPSTPPSSRAGAARQLARASAVRASAPGGSPDEPPGITHQDLWATARLLRNVLRYMARYCILLSRHVHWGSLRRKAGTIRQCCQRTRF